MKIAICDDEKIFRDRIAEFLQPYQAKDPEITTSEFCCGEDLLAAYEAGESFDLIYLDIQMKDIDGVETAQKIRKTDQKAIFIFITSYVRFISEACRVGTFQFLLKPVAKEDFGIDFERAVRSYKLNHEKRLFRQKDGSCIINISEIIYIEIYKKHLFVNTEKEKYDCIGTMAEEEKKLKMYHFAACHKSYLINLKFVKIIGIDNIELTNGKKIPLSKNCKSGVKSALNDYILECSI